MMWAMIKAAAKVIKGMPWWQKVLIGSATTIAFSATEKVMEYFIQEIVGRLEDWGQVNVPQFNGHFKKYTDGYTMEKKGVSDEKTEAVI
jgi:hypothetical protein